MGPALVHRADPLLAAEMWKVSSASRSRTTALALADPAARPQNAPGGILRRGGSVMPPGESFQALMTELRGGSPGAAHAVFQRYAHRLRELAGRRLSLKI